MKSNQQDIELLDAYLKGNLQEDERSLLERRLEVEDDLMADLESLKLLSAGIRVESLKEKWELLRSLESGLSGGESNQSKWFSLKIAILILFIIGLLFVLSFYFLSLKNIDNQPIAWNDDDFYKYILHKTVRNNQMDTDAQKSLAYNLFTIQEFKEAKPKLKDLWLEQNDTLSYFYLGITELSLGNKDEARMILNSEALQNYPIEDLLILCE